MVASVDGRLRAFRIPAAADEHGLSLPRWALRRTDVGALALSADLLVRRTGRLLLGRRPQHGLHRQRFGCRVRIARGRSGVVPVQSPLLAARFSPSAANIDYRFSRVAAFY